METRKSKAVLRRPGGNASKNAEAYRVNIPTKWAKDMGITPDERNLKITYENKKMIVEKGTEEDE